MGGGWARWPLEGGGGGKLGGGGKKGFLSERRRGFQDEGKLEMDIKKHTWGEKKGDNYVWGKNTHDERGRKGVE